MFGGDPVDEQTELLEALRNARQTWLGYRNAGNEVMAERALAYMDDLLADLAMHMQLAHA